MIFQSGDSVYWFSIMGQRGKRVTSIIFKHASTGRKEFRFALFNLSH